jgi:hypothetical protein
MKIENFTTIRLDKDALHQLMAETIATKLNMRLAYLEWVVGEDDNVLSCKLNMCAETQEI